MLPLQEINITTKNRCELSVHLERWSEAHFKCKLAAIELGPTILANATFGPYAQGATALDAFRELIEKLHAELSRMNPPDSVVTIDNPVNTEFVSADDQRKIAGPDAIIKVNGAVA